MDGGGSIDILRLSMNVKRNIAREEQDNGEENYHTKETQAQHKAGMTNIGTQNRGIQQKPSQPKDKPEASVGSSAVELDDLGASPDDIKLQDRNIVLNFGVNETNEDAASDLQGLPETEPTTQPSASS